MALSQSIVLKVLPSLVRGIIRCLGMTYRYRLAGWDRVQRVVESGDAIVGACFHGRQACLTYFFSRPGRGPWTVMVSRSKDGELQHRILSGLGLHTVRGSSGRGGARALVDLIEAIATPPTHRVVMAVDGSRGPIWHVKPGVLMLADRGDAWLIPCVGSANRAWVFRKTWDLFTIPKPWSQIGLVFGKPIRLPPDLSTEALERLRDRYQVLMDGMRNYADRLAGRRWK